MKELLTNGDPRAAAALIFFAAAALCYLIGGTNGALVASRLFYRDDIRKYGSGNPGLTNFYRIYGAKRVWCVLLLDMGKAAAAIALGAWVFGPEGTVFGKYFAAAFCVLGHMFPAFHHFKGGKGILCSGMAIILFDWRVALAGWGAFLLMTLLTKYVSLGSICAAVSLPIATWAVYRAREDFVSIFVCSLAISALVLWGHRKNMERLVKGTERKLKLHRSAEEKTADGKTDGERGETA